MEKISLFDADLKEKDYIHKILALKSPLAPGTEMGRLGRKGDCNSGGGLAAAYSCCPPTVG